MAQQARTTPSAAHRVFNIGELVEMIFLAIGACESHSNDDIRQAEIMRSILLSQRINHTTRTAVQHSGELKQMLHMQIPAKDEQRLFHVHPLLRPHLPTSLSSWKSVSPIGITHTTKPSTIYFTFNDKMLAFMSQDQGSWRQSLVSCDKQALYKCDIILDGSDRRPMEGSILLVFEVWGAETAGELADGVLEKLKKRYPGWFHQSRISAVVKGRLKGRK